MDDGAVCSPDDFRMISFRLFGAPTSRDETNILTVGNLPEGVHGLALRVTTVRAYNAAA